MSLALQEAQQYLIQYVTYEHAKALENTPAFTVMSGDKPVACGGAIDYWMDRAEAWSYISDDIGPRLFLRMHHAVKRFFDAHGATRIEAYVDCQFPEGHRWALALGFKVETPRLEKYWPGGRDATCYVRIK
jgi:hypothetical protein